MSLIFKIGSQFIIHNNNILMKVYLDLPRHRFITELACWKPFCYKKWMNVTLNKSKTTALIIYNRKNQIVCSFIKLDGKSIQTGDSSVNPLE